MPPPLKISLQALSDDGKGNWGMHQLLQQVKQQLGTCVQQDRSAIDNSCTATEDTLAVTGCVWDEGSREHLPVSQV